MSLIDVMRADVQTILNDKDTGAAVQIFITDPSGTREEFTGFSNDIGLLIDPDTGQAVSGRKVTVAVSMIDLQAVSFSNPQAIPDEDSDPWIIEFEGNFFRVTSSEPDRTLQLVTCTLEGYKPLS